MNREDKVNNEIKGNKNLRNLIVNYVPLSFRERHLMKLFRTAGPISSCRIMRYVENGKTFSKGYGFVLFERPEDASKAIEEFNGKEVLTKTIKVAYARPNARRSVSNLFVAHIPPHWTDKDLGKLFIDYGKIIESRVLLNSCGLSRCCGFVRFDSNVQAEKAVKELNGHQPAQHDAPLLVRIAFKSVTTKNASSEYMKYLVKGENMNYQMPSYNYAENGSESGRGYSSQSSSRPGSARSVPSHPKREEIASSGYSSTGYRTSIIKPDPAYSYRYTGEGDLPPYEERFPSFSNVYKDTLFDKPNWSTASDYGSAYGSDMQATDFGRDSYDYKQYNKHSSQYDHGDYYAQSSYGSSQKKTNSNFKLNYRAPEYEPRAQASLDGNNSAGDANTVADEKHALRVFNLPPKSEESEIRKLFAKYGELTQLKVPKTVDGLTIGMAHVYYGDDVSAQAAQKNLNGAQFLSSKLVVEFIPEESKFTLVATPKPVKKAQGRSQQFEKSPDFASRAVQTTKAPIAQLVEAQ